jgi:predicted Fe-Mo cluster-binding NifX family protein
MAYNVAVTTSDGTHVDLHFGRAVEFQIIEVDENTANWKNVGKRIIPEEGPLPAAEVKTGGIACNPAGGCGGRGHTVEAVMRAVSVIQDCPYLLTAKIGPKPSDVLKHSGITALESPYDISEAITKLNKYHLREAISK